MKKLRVVLGQKELDRLYNRQPVTVRTPKGEELDIMFSITIKKPEASVERIEELLNKIGGKR